MTGELFLLHSALGRELGVVTAGVLPTAAAESGSETPGTDGLCTACPAPFSSFFPSGNLC